MDSPEPAQRKRFKFLSGQIKLTKDFNTIDVKEIQEIFER